MVKNELLNIDKEIISGEKLYGDDYSFEMIKEWYNKESISYEKQFKSSIQLINYSYSYFALNNILGFNKISKKLKFKNILSFGGGMGYEIEAIIQQTENIYIIEPSKILRRTFISGKEIHYIDPSISGKIEFPDGFFDVITCFGVLMYIPNVTYVLSELNRCLAKNGYLLIREPSTNFGCGLVNRLGCGENTRGISIIFFKNWISKNNFSVSTITHHRFGPLVKIFGIFNFNTYNNIFITKLDIFLCRLFQFNYKYQRKYIWEKLAPGSTFIFLKK